MSTLGLDRLEETAELGRSLIAQLPGAGLIILDVELRRLPPIGDDARREAGRCETHDA
jgi:hypothetical protein